VVGVVGTKGLPAKARRRASNAVRPFFRAVETQRRMRQKATRASKRRNVPEIFCRSFIIRRSRSETLFSNGTAKSRLKARMPSG